MKKILIAKLIYIDVNYCAIWHIGEKYKWEITCVYDNDTCDIRNGVPLPIENPCTQPV